jgi:hypothetical protein
MGFWHRLVEIQALRIEPKEARRLWSHRKEQPGGIEGLSRTPPGGVKPGFASGATRQIKPLDHVSFR